MLEYAKIKEALAELKGKHEVAFQTDLEMSLKASDLPGIKYSAGQLNGMRLHHQAIMVTLQKLWEENNA